MSNKVGRWERKEEIRALIEELQYTPYRSSRESEQGSRGETIFKVMGNFQDGIRQ